jgi:hypothetical protein
MQMDHKDLLAISTSHQLSVPLLEDETWNIPDIE